MQNVQAVLEVLPARYRMALQGWDWEEIQELRMRAGQPFCIRTNRGEQPVPCAGRSNAADLEFVLAAATGQSAYSAVEALEAGYFTLPGGHRIGVCGTVSSGGDGTQRLQALSSLNLRIAHDIWLEPAKLAPCLQDSLLIVGPPGSGKTTLLRACIRTLSRMGACVGVVDERGEVSGFELGMHVDVLRGAKKQAGMERLLRTMNPDWIALDEISAEADVLAVEKTSYCGVKLLATAHAAGMDELERRSVYRKLLDTGVFRTALVLQKDWTYSEERMRR